MYSHEKRIPGQNNFFFAFDFEFVAGLVQAGAARYFRTKLIPDQAQSWAGPGWAGLGEEAQTRRSQFEGL